MTRFVALAGGVGGARLARGLAHLLPPEELLVVVNTGDDFEHLGLAVSPDLDTVMYTLAGIENPALGWGIAGETWAFLAALDRLGGETWFKLGDQDLATHIERTRRLAAGESLSAVTRRFCDRLGVGAAVAPMTDDRVRTILHTDAGVLSFQDYFVRRRCEPRVVRVAFDGADRARPSPALAAALADPRLEAVVICPSNPFLSVAPILAVPAVREWWSRRSRPVVAVSPIVGGEAVKGPAAKLFREFGAVASAQAVAEYYADRVDAWLLDRRDQALAPVVRASGRAVGLADTLMTDAAASARVARAVLSLAEEVRER